VAKSFDWVAGVYCLDYTGVITGIHCGAGFGLDAVLVLSVFGCF
jgi:hypothetical protein